MNDFTIEELQILLNWCVCRNKDINTVDFEREGSGRLFGKIKLMIDQYCDHDWQESIHDGDIEICIKCGYRKLWTN